MEFSKEELRLFEKNKKCFMKNFSGLYNDYLNNDLPKNIELYRKNGEVDILINGERFYGEDAYVFTGKQIEVYLESPAIIEVNPPGATIERTPTHITFDEEFDRKCQARDIYASIDRIKIDVANTFVFGIGLGLHLHPLVIHTRCRELVIVEPEPVFLLLSMYFIDWTKLLKTLKGRLVIIIQKEGDAAYLLMRSHITTANPAVQQCLFHYTHYRAPYIDSILKSFEEKVQYFFDGLGFYDDEKVMMRNHFLSMYKSKWKLCSAVVDRVKGSAVVVGAGPSLNNDLSWLRDNQDKLIIFSGGSALQTLLKNGITPDFHVEIENIAMNYDLLKPLVTGYDLSETVLICSSTMDTRSAYLFNRRMWFFREGVTCSRMFDFGITTTQFQNPTVINSALSAALTLGFRNILLLGADFGTRNQSIHHSKDTAYETFDELKTASFDFPDKVSANFGGQVHTNSHYRNGLISLEYLLNNFRTAMVFNGSDGAHINRTIPIRSKAYRIDPLMDKKYLVEQIYSSAEEIDWGEKLSKDFFDDVAAEFSEFCTLSRKMISDSSRKNRDFILYISKSYVDMSILSENVRKYFSMVSGSLTSIDTFLIFWWRRAPTERLTAFEKLARHMRLRFMTIMENDFKRFIRKLKSELPLARPELFDDKGNLITDAKLDVQNAE